ncbi:hypothetical protein [Clostridium sp.]|uniref:hypothetical protein n=1 Tax=Clostridium sp. TaxID=1506 RepID=UPI001A3B8D06|nr:hypothetical protein [Clostridium sp.]MBK5241503.1 hypothetical protein [Clostridium sp.]
MVNSINNKIEQGFKINIKNGNGIYDTGLNNTFWSRLNITAKIIEPQNGIWDIIIRDKTNKNLVIFHNNHMLHDKEVSFNYITGLRTNLVIEANWTEAKDTILSGEICILY